MLLEEFADKHGLTMEVRERRLDGEARTRNLARWVASFQRCEVKGEGVLIGSYGNGNTPEEAIADYASKIRGEVLVVDAMTGSRREIPCPNEWIGLRGWL